ncbi:hypothetical protein A0H81_02427 [Grifola frondosa]|uniref:Uncharacterized protein n=1 Tax=Grifola frondosa TaxID=5627 RepID=A0A1C7MLH7_GRIFR|nr:hypothetical protein A0H81_02427 [Grifola frondosa]
MMGPQSCLIHVSFPPVFLCLDLYMRSISTQAHLECSHALPAILTVDVASFLHLGLPVVVFVFASFLLVHVRPCLERRESDSHHSCSTFCHGRSVRTSLT